MENFNESVFESFYIEQLPRVYNFFRYRFSDDRIAEDLTSQTFEKAWKHRNRYQNRLGAFSTWLFTIAHRIAIDTYRRIGREISIEEIADRLSGENIETEETLREQMVQLGCLLDGLPDREREIIALKYGAGLNNRQIAKIIKISESNVGVIVHRTVKHLREKWEDLND